MPYNLASPNYLLEPVDLSNLSGWFEREITQVESQAIRQVVRHINVHLSDFVRWPSRALLLWEGCDRVVPRGKKQRYHCYPEGIRSLAKSSWMKLDTRPNGPAIAAFQLAGGERPLRFGSSNSWSVHHIYSGKFPYTPAARTTHAAKEPKHFTQSAGLIATHPLADAVCDELPFFSWQLRAESFRRFGYDPDGVFSERQDENGFTQGTACEIVWR